MYVTGMDYDTGKPISVARGAGDRFRQRQALLNPQLRRASRGSGRVFVKPSLNPMSVVATAEEEDAPNW
jgi:hypothetical protein